MERPSTRTDHGGNSLNTTQDVHPIYQLQITVRRCACACARLLVSFRCTVVRYDHRQASPDNARHILQLHTRSDPHRDRAHMQLTTPPAQLWGCQLVGCVRLPDTATHYAEYELGVA